VVSFPKQRIVSLTSYTFLNLAHRKRDTLFKELGRIHGKTLTSKNELARRLSEAETKAATARRQAGLAKGQGSY